ncbi:MAG: type I restriction endonuclease subunit R [Lentisphaeria bacterium]|nr:type I restriction endonuclease subunit R [Lentisphaeria bacterium]
MFTDTKEHGLEMLIVDWLRDHNGYEQGGNHDYDRDHALDVTRLFRFLYATQPEEMAKLHLDESEIKRKQFLDRIQGEIAKRGIIDVLRKGISVYPANLTLYYLTPSAKNARAAEQFDRNIFSVTRQLQFSNDNTKLALDLAIFINGLPVITCELKNQLTKQNVQDAVEQYQTDRDPRELLFNFKRCMVHFAVDDAEVRFCTRLTGKDSWFLPFNKGYNDGAGNPPNPDGLKTDYLWKEILTKRSLADIIENYAQVVVEVDKKTKKKKEKQIFPRFHQLAVVRSLLGDTFKQGVGHKYLIQHSAGSGKSNSIAWLAHQLIGLEKNGKNLISSVIVVTDRVNLDKQIKDTIKQFMQVSSTVAWATTSGELREAIEKGKKIIITTVHKFPWILDEVGSAGKNATFAIIIDEAHSSQNGRLSAKMNVALSGEYDPDDSIEDKVNALMEGRKMLKNASYYAFTATPKNKTLEIFGEPFEDGGVIKHRPYHNYSMKQAIQEGFILDVLKYYTPITSYYKLAKTSADNPLFDKKKAQKRLRAFVESNDFPISRKAGIIVDHFHEQVIAKGKIGGQARAMVVCSSIERAITYYKAICRCLEERHSPYKAIIAFSGEKEYDGKMQDEASINGFPGKDIEDTFREEPYRFLIVAEKFQTGYDEPLLHTMYVDKELSDIKAVQTLSRLNRACPKKNDTFILDFADQTEQVKAAFDRYYRTTILSAETDPNKLYDLISDLESAQVYTEADVEKLLELFLSGAPRDKLDPILDACADIYKNNLDEDGQVKFKGSAKSFVRTYEFLGAILPYADPKWEKLSTFLTLLIPKLPSPQNDDPNFEELLKSIDLDSYRVEVKKQISISLEDADAEVDPVPVGGGGHKPEPEYDELTSILKTFNDLWGNIDWKDKDNVQAQIARIPEMVSQDAKYQAAMKNSDRQNARLESDAVLASVMFNLMSDNIELYKQYNDDPNFKKWLSDMVFNLTYNKGGKPFVSGTNNCAGA